MCCQLLIPAGCMEEAFRCRGALLSICAVDDALMGCSWCAVGNVWNVYGPLLDGMITSWRAQLAQPDLRFTVRASAASIATSAVPPPPAPTPLPG